MRHLISAAILMAAYACYMAGTGPELAGVPAPGAALMMAGVSLELAFWLRLRRGSNAKIAARA